MATVLVNLALDSFKYMCVCACVHVRARTCMCIPRYSKYSVLINYNGVKGSGDKSYVGKCN